MIKKYEFMNKIILYSNYKKYEKEFSKVKGNVLKTLKILKKDNFKAEIFFVLEKEIRNLNKEYRKKDKATNVLSFENVPYFVEPKRKQRLLGEIYLCPEYINQKGQNMSALAVHGLLHLLGFDHIKKEERRIMEVKEEELFTKLKIGFFV